MKILLSVLLIVNGNIVIRKVLNVHLIKMFFNFTSTLEEIIIVVKMEILFGDTREEKREKKKKKKKKRCLKDVYIYIHIIILKIYIIIKIFIFIFIIFMYLFIF